MDEGAIGISRIVESVVCPPQKREVKTRIDRNEKMIDWIDSSSMHEVRRRFIVHTILYFSVPHLETPILHYLLAYSAGIRSWHFARAGQ